MPVRANLALYRMASCLLNLGFQLALEHLLADVQQLQKVQPIDAQALDCASRFRVRAASDNPCMLFLSKDATPQCAC